MKPIDPSLLSAIAPRAAVDAATHAAGGVEKAGAANAAKAAAAKADPKALKAAREFEAIFLRQMLSALEKTNSASGSSGSGGSPSASAGGGIYGSMMVGSLADSLAASGGIGLADVIARSLTPHVPNAAQKTSVVGETQDHPAPAPAKTAAPMGTSTSSKGSTGGAVPED
jgi:flagellar protein FlgJ